MNTNATGPRAHAEGYKTNVFASEGHAEGRGTWCLGAQSACRGIIFLLFRGWFACRRRINRHPALFY